MPCCGCEAGFQCFPVTSDPAPSTLQWPSTSLMGASLLAVLRQGACCLYFAWWLLGYVILFSRHSSPPFTASPQGLLKNRGLSEGFRTLPPASPPEQVPLLSCPSEKPSAWGGWPLSVCSHQPYCGGNQQVWQDWQRVRCQNDLTLPLLLHP